MHDAAYIDCVRLCGEDPSHHELGRGLGSDDNPTFHGMHEAGARVVTASVEAARRVWSGDVLRAVNPSGGLHHAMPDTASGFCVYNDVAVAIAWLLEQGAARVAYVDVDVHHGDGVQAIFYDDPRVLTDQPARDAADALSRAPGRRRRPAVRAPPAVPSTWRCRRAPRTRAGCAPSTRSSRTRCGRSSPTVLVTQHGCDSHRHDPLAHLMLTVDGQRASYLALADLAREVTAGRWVATGGGGYAIADVVPRAWTHLLAVVGGRPLDPSTPTPQAWRDHVRELVGRTAPETMTDGVDPVYKDWSGGYDPGDWLDRSVLATRNASFPLLGLDPHL